MENMVTTVVGSTVLGLAAAGAGYLLSTIRKAPAPRSSLPLPHTPSISTEIKEEIKEIFDFLREPKHFLLPKSNQPGGYDTITAFLEAENAIEVSSFTELVLNSPRWKVLLESHFIKFESDAFHSKVLLQRYSRKFAKILDEINRWNDLRIAQAENPVARNLVFAPSTPPRRVPALAEVETPPKTNSSAPTNPPVPVPHPPATDSQFSVLLAMLQASEARFQASEARSQDFERKMAARFDERASSKPPGDLDRRRPTKTTGKDPFISLSDLKDGIEENGDDDDDDDDDDAADNRSVTSKEDREEKARMKSIGATNEKHDTFAVEFQKSIRSTGFKPIADAAADLRDNAKGLQLKAANGLILKVCWPPQSKKGTEAKREVEVYAIQRGKPEPTTMPKARGNFSVVWCLTKQEFRKFVDEQMRALLAVETQMSALELQKSITGLLDFQRYYIDRFHQVLSPDGRLRPDALNQTQYTDGAILSTSIYTSFNQAMISNDLPGLSSIARDNWKEASSYLAAQNSNVPHGQTPYLEAAVLAGLQCPTPSCRAIGASENLCVNCQNFPPNFPLVSKNKVLSQEYVTFCATTEAKNLKNNHEREKAFKDKFPGKSTHKYTSKDGTTVDHAKFWAHIAVNQGSIVPPAALAAASSN